MTTRALTDSEVLLIEDTLRRRGKFRDVLLLLLGLDTGFRAGELLSIEWAQLLTPAGGVRTDLIVERAELKGGAGARRKVVRSRRVPLTERVRNAIADHLGTMPSMPTGPVFRSRVGSNHAISRELAHRNLKELARELGFDASRIGLHSTRKSFASRVHKAAQFDLIKTQRILGHCSPITTSKYLETTVDELDAVVMGLDNVPSSTLPAEAFPLRTSGSR